MEAEKFVEGIISGKLKPRKKKRNNVHNMQSAGPGDGGTGTGGSVAEALRAAGIDPATVDPSKLQGLSNRSKFE